MKFLFKEKKILENFSYLSMLQVGRYLIPLIIVPYLIRTIGSELYGLVIFAQSVIAYFVLLVDYGFNLTGVREVSIHRDDINKLSSIVSGILIIKLSFFIFSSVVLIVIASFINIINENIYLFTFTLWMCLYEVVFPKWYFQGIEKMKLITIIDLLFKVLFLILVIVFIKSPSDYLLIPLLNGIGVIISGILSLYIIYGKHKIHFNIPRVSYLMKLVKESTPVFVSKVSQFYIKLNKILIGSFIGFNEVAYYDVAEKIVNVAKMPITIFGQAIFPKISKERNINYILKSFTSIIVFNALIIFFIYLKSDFLIHLFIDEYIKKASMILLILSISLLPITINVFFSTQSLFGFGYNKEFMMTILTASIVYLLSVGIMHITNTWSVILIASIVVVSEYGTAISAIYYNWKLKLLTKK